MILLYIASFTALFFFRPPVNEKTLEIISNFYSTTLGFFLVGISILFGSQKLYTLYNEIDPLKTHNRKIQTIKSYYMTACMLSSFSIFFTIIASLIPSQNGVTKTLLCDIFVYFPISAASPLLLLVYLLLKQLMNLMINEAQINKKS